MNLDYFTLLTEIGEARLANAIVLGQKLDFVTMSFGDGAGAVPIPDRKQQKLVNEVHRTNINHVFPDPNNPSYVVIETVLPENVGGWWIREYAVHDSDGNTLAVANCPPSYKPILAEGASRTQTVRMVLAIASAANVQLKIDPSVVLATRQYVDDMVAAAAGRIKHDVTVTYPVGTLGHIINKAVLNSPANRAALSSTPIVLVGWGQSNQLGANSGGPNPASPLVKSWDAVAGTWGASDYTKRPWSLPAPNGNSGCNNLTLALAHRLADETGRPVYIIFDARSGRPISDWIGAGKESERYAAGKGKIDAALASPELVSAGVKRVDAFVWMQGEADYLRTFDEYLADLKTLVSQLRSESWFPKTTPILLGEMSDLHDRYEPKKAIQWLGGGIDPWVISVNSKGLATSDQTHYLGADLWEFGYHRFYRALQHVPRSWHIPQTIWRNRDGIAAGMPGANPKYGDAVVYTESSIFAGGADRNPNYKGALAVGPAVSQGAANGIAVGASLTVTSPGCAVFGVGSSVSDIDCLVAGYLHVVSGRYSVVSGYGNTVSGQYAGAFGRGHTVVDPYCYAYGGFSEFKTPRADPAMHQFGISNDASKPRNGLTLFASGLALFGGSIDFKEDAKSTVGTPSHRADVVYASTATINTSDARLKKVRGPLTRAEMAAWARIQPCIYQFIESVEEKGEESARLHAGLIAQDVMRAFESEGLDPARYAMFCIDDVFIDDIVVETKTVQRQKTVSMTVHEIDIVDGKPVRTPREVLVPQFVEQEVVDESGAVVIDDETGEPLMYRIPVMEMAEEEVRTPVNRPAGTRYGLRYTECLMFESAYLRTLHEETREQYDKLTARVEQLER
ncbi:phage tail protein [Burkholderia sp. SCN-KJ]|uniref:phage tail-collar fiber domain-containing protein n=1 Tax=Burkholderia sp. SCN-KJ TaxID=2969248 RepID=UPI0021505079|nr:phage tail protein [Burkholderia sp. SCN-KJ]MCR4465851.1 phage tail protein [Burkholderia sp. SCN-KJ]